jgi:phosphoketolase
MPTRHTTFSPELLARTEACWRAGNCQSVGQGCLCDNPLLRAPLAMADERARFAQAMDRAERGEWLAD